MDDQEIESSMKNPLSLHQNQQKKADKAHNIWYKIEYVENSLDIERNPFL